MAKRVVGKHLYELLRQEVKYYSDSGIINGEQADRIMGLYQIKQGLSFLRVVLVTGAVLVGLGVLSFIASNWDVIGKLSKYLIIMAAFLSVNLTGYLLFEKHPKTSRSLLYLAALIYGAGIFLVGQIFNFSGHFTSAFLLWAVGIFPAAVLFRDKMIYVFSTLLLLVYVNGHFELGSNPWAVLAALPVLYYCNRYLNDSDVIVFFTNLVTLNTIGFFAFQYEMTGLFIAVLFFLLGVIMLYFFRGKHKLVFEIQGKLAMGISGLILTIPQVWETWEKAIARGSGDVYSIIFTVLFVVYLLVLTKKEDLIALIFICFTIFRYYFDLTYDFLPKSVFFIISGVMLLTFGFFIERQIKRKGGPGHDE